MICVRTDYHPQFLRLIDKWGIRWSQTCMDTLPLCMFFKIKVILCWDSGLSRFNMSCCWSCEVW